MDISSEYIKMCENAEEIQEICLKENLFADSVVYVVPLELTLKTVVWWGTQVGTFFYFDQSLRNFRSTEIVWLPRQEQIQEIMEYGFGSLIAGETLLLLEFVRSLADKFQFTSWEQLWLAFAMKEKFNKEWNGFEWIKGGI